MALTIDNELIERFARHLDKAQNIVIVTHQNPDGDAVGSVLACYHWLRSAFFAGRAVPHISMVLPNSCPPDATYLPAAQEMVDADGAPELCRRLIAEADLLLGVDFNTAGRVQPLDGALTASGAVKLLVDHHHCPDTALFPTAISMPDISSTCELLYWVFVQLIGDSSVNTDVARCLYHGINTDTGCFAYSNEDESLYEATAALMRRPLEAAKVHDRLFNSYSIKKMELLGFLISQRMRLFPEVGFAYFYINADDLQRMGGTADDLEGLVNYTLMMKPMQVGAMVKETHGRVRMSFRAKGDFDVNRFARTYFGGGGHTKASGATSPYGFDETLRRLETHIIEELKHFQS